MTGTKYPELFAALAQPFEPSEVKVLSKAGRQLHYVTARTVMNRLDETLGPENWWDSYVSGAESVLCSLTILLPDGRALTKCDAGGYAGMADQGDDDKSGFSDSFKRAAVKFGVARYLYRDGVPTFVAPDEPAAEAPPVATRKLVPPAIAAQAAAQSSNCDAISREVHNRPRLGFEPQTGHELYGWLMKREKEYPGVMKRLHDWAAEAKLPVKMLGWEPAVVKRAYLKVTTAIDAMDRERQATPEPSPEAPVPTAGNGAYSRR